MFGVICFIKYNLQIMLIYVVTALTIITQVMGCHYSCATCTGPEYVSCLSCYNNASFVETVEDPTIMPSQYWSSVYPSGTCVDTLAPSANAIGIIFFILLVGICLFFRTKQSFYLLLTFQTYGLYNLVEIAWVNPLGYVLQGLQYLMIFNTMGYGYKTQDYILVASKNYRLHKYLQTTSIASNLAIIAAFTLIPLVILIVLSVIAIRKEKKAQQKKKEDVVFQSIASKSQQSKRGRIQEEGESEEEKNQSCYCWKHFSEEFLIKLAKFMLCFLFLMVQETCLVLLVTLVYVTPVSAGIIALCVIYLHILVFVMSYSYYYRIEYFKEKKIMYLTYAQKIIMPVMVVVPIDYQYVFFIFAAAFLILEFVFDYQNQLYQSFNRLALYKVAEALTVIMLTIYYIVETNADSLSSSKAAGIASTFLMIINLFFFVAVEIPMSIKEKYFTDNSSKPPLEEKQMNEVIQEDTLDNLQPEPESNKMHALIIEDHKSSGSDQQNQKQGVENQPNPHDKDKENDLTGDGNNSSVGGNKEHDQTSLAKSNQRQPPNDIEENDGIEEIQLPQKVKVQPRNEQEEQPKVQKELARKKRRKQIIDPELRQRYGL